MTLLRRLAAALGYELRPEPESEGVRALRRHAENLNGAAANFRRMVARIVMLEHRLDGLDGDVLAWERRSKSPAVLADPELGRDVARMLGRIEGRRLAAREELRELETREQVLGELLASERKRFVELLEDAQAMGLDVSRCVLEIDLTRPPPPEPDTLPDDEEDFLARVVDSTSVH